ncbi:PIN domain-containing protein [Candidatus Microgenomates bacterium]|nr:PIN domain-containing protein [Candidatus Microgenomates bacterium]
MDSSQKQVFVDSSMFFALVDEKDQFHQKAIQIWQTLKKQRAQLITSNYMLDETFTLFRSRRGIKVVDDFRKSLTDVYEIKIIRVTVADEAGAWEWFLKDWSKLSFTDCVSFALMKRLELKWVSTFDEHFRRAGFTIV